MMKKINNKLKWTEEKCFEAAKECTSKTDMKKKFCRAFHQAQKHGWIEQYTWFRTTQIKWTREACYEAAKECANLTEFREKYVSAYDRSRECGWVEEYTWLKNGRRDIHKKVYTVYAYEDTVHKKVYVGLTNNIKRRIMEHKKKDYKHSFRTYDRIREHFEKYSMEIPKPIILIDGINGIEAQEKEGYYVEEYCKNGWDVINISKTGKGCSSLGNVGAKWTYEECKKVSEKCKTRKELEKVYSGAMYAIRQNNWLELLPPKKEFCTMAKKECVEFCKSIKSMDDLKMIDEKIYSRIKNKKWITACFPRKMYNEEECLKMAQNYHSFAELKRNDKVLAYSIKKLKLTNVLYKIEKPEYSADDIKQIPYQYNNRSKLLRENYSLYQYCKENDLLDKLLPLKNFKWTLEEAVEEAKKYKGRDAFRTAHHKAYDILRKHNLLDIMLPKLTTQKKKTKTVTEKPLKKDKPIKKIKQNITETDCFNAASKCQYKRDFREEYPKEYAVASRNKWLKNYTWLKGCKRVVTNKECINAAKLCSTKCEFRERFLNEYTFARENGLLQCFTWLKRKKQTS